MLGLVGNKWYSVSKQDVTRIYVIINTVGSELLCFVKIKKLRENEHATEDTKLK